MWMERLQKELTVLRKQSRLRELCVDDAFSFSHNDYLGLSQHPEIVDAGKRALERQGAGGRGSRLLGGHTFEVVETEARIAEFFGSPDALLFPTGYQANLGVLQGLAPLADAVASDANNHASLIDGIRLSKLEREIVPHQAWGAWEPKADRRYLLVAESLYSMDGDFVDAQALRDAWTRSQGFLVLDEAHAAGVFALSGRGMSEPWRDWNRMAVVVTFGKAFGVAGGAVLCAPALKQWLVNCARTFIYSTALPPAVPAMIAASIRVLNVEGDSLRQRLWSRARRLRAFLREQKLPVGQGDGEWAMSSPILPLFIPGNDRALRFAQSMRDSGWHLRAIRYPTVPQGLERIRLSLNLQASEAQTESMAKELVEQWKAFS